MKAAPGPGLDRLEKARLLVEAALDRKAEEVVALDVRESVSFADTFVIATGTTDATRACEPEPSPTSSVRRPITYSGRPIPAGRTTGYSRRRTSSQRLASLRRLCRYNW